MADRHAFAVCATDEYTAWLGERLGAFGQVHVQPQPQALAPGGHLPQYVEAIGCGLRQFEVGRSNFVCRGMRRKADEPQHKQCTEPLHLSAAADVPGQSMITWYRSNSSR